MSRPKSKKRYPGSDAIFARLCEALGVDSQVALADALGIRQSNVSDAVRSGSIPELWLYKVAETTGRRVEWLRTGRGPALKDALLQELITRTESLKTYTDDPQRWATERGAISGMISDVEKVVRLAERATVMAESVAEYAPPGVDDSGLDEDERETVRRLIAAFRSGNPQVRAHLIGQLRLIDELVQAQRDERTSRAKKTAD